MRVRGAMASAASGRSSSMKILLSCWFIFLDILFKLRINLCMHTVVFYTNGLSIVSTVFNYHFSKQQQAVMITAKYHCYNIWLSGLIVWLLDCAGSSTTTSWLGRYRPSWELWWQWYNCKCPPTSSNNNQYNKSTSYVSAQFVTFTESLRSDGVCCRW